MTFQRTHSLTRPLPSDRLESDLGKDSQQKRERRGFCFSDINVPVFCSGWRWLIQLRWWTFCCHNQMSHLPVCELFNWIWMRFQYITHGEENQQPQANAHIWRYRWVTAYSTAVYSHTEEVMITFKMAAGYCCMFDIYEGYFEKTALTVG